jgi:hypothetical protein
VTYLDAPEAPERIAKTLPDVKLIFLLRDPVERAYSHYRYTVAHCLESWPFAEALVWEPYRALHTPEVLRIARPWAYVARGQYSRHRASSARGRTRWKPGWPPASPAARPCSRWCAPPCGPR